MFTTRTITAIATSTAVALIGTIGVVAVASDDADPSAVDPPTTAAVPATTTASTPEAPPADDDGDQTAPDVVPTTTPDTPPADDREQTASPIEPTTTPDTPPADDDGEQTASPIEPTTTPQTPRAENDGDRVTDDVPAAAAAPATDAPVDANDPEQPAPGEPGTYLDGEIADDPLPAPPPVSPPSGPTDLVAVPKPPPPLPEIPGPVDLVIPPMDPGPPPIDDLVAPSDATPYAGAADLRATPTPGRSGTLDSGLIGCQLECVTSAVLTSSPSGPDVVLDLATNVPAHLEVYVRDADGGPTERFDSPGFRMVWSMPIAPLEPDTTYDMAVLVEDRGENTREILHRFTTPAVLDGFATDATGCQLECLTVGTVRPDGAPNDVEVHVESNSPAALQVFFTTAEPTWIDDPTAKPPPESHVFGNDNHATSWTFDVKDLEYDTLYHVVAIGRDEHGEHHLVGTFRTGTRPSIDVLVKFEQVTILHDGDPGADRGEIELRWGFDDWVLGGRSEEKLSEVTLDLRGNTVKVFRFDPTTQSIPNFHVSATERDADGLAEYCTFDIRGLEPHYSSSCDRRRNVAHHGGPIGMEEILALPRCLDWGIIAGDDARCIAIGTATFGSDHPQYVHLSAIVSFYVQG